MEKFENYSMYQRCLKCGQVLTDLEIEDNECYCDTCYEEINSWYEYPVGILYEKRAKV